MNCNLQKFADRFINLLETERNLTKNSIIAYTNDVVKFIKWYESDTDKQDVLKDYLNSLNNVTSSTKARKGRSLRQFLEFCNKDMGLNIEFTVPKITVVQSLPKTFSNSDFQKLREYLEKEKSVRNLRFKVLIELLYSTGVRVSELVALRIDTLRPVVEHAETKVLITGKGRKERYVYLSERACTVLKEYWNHCKENTYLFEARKRVICRQTVHAWLKTLAHNIGIDSKLLFAHAFRHRLGSDLVRNNMNLLHVKKVLGHENVSTTAIYSHMKDVELEETLQQNHPLSNKKDTVSL